MKRLLLLALRLYQGSVSPYLPSQCRYVPTCSSYSHQALERYGALRGSWLTARRLARCHPWGGQGFDPLP